MPIYEKLGKNIKQQLRFNIVTNAAIGDYFSDVNLEIPGNLKQVSGGIIDLTVSNINLSIINIYRTLPLPNIAWVYGFYCESLRIYVYQPDATARTVRVNLDVVIE